MRALIFDGRGCSFHILLVSAGITYLLTPAPSTPSTPQYGYGGPQQAAGGMGMGISVEGGMAPPPGADAYYHGSKDKGVRPAVRARSAARSLLLGACAVGGLLGLLSLTGVLSPRAAHTGTGSAAYTKAGIAAGPRRSLRGRAAVVLLAGGSGSRIEKGKVDHHHARVLLVPSLEPFSRRNVHHYRVHDAEGKLAPLGGHRNDSERHVHVEWAEVRERVGREELACLID